MSYKCRICGSNDVENPGDICELCAIGQDPYAASISVPSSGIGHDSDNGGGNDAGSNRKRGRGRKILIGAGNDGAEAENDEDDIAVSGTPQTVQVYSAGQVPQLGNNTTSVATTVPVRPSVNQPITSGITKNINVDNEKKPFLAKWFRALFMGIPYATEDEVTMFQVFPDYTGTSLNASGNACDQVIVYGKVNHGSISENNDVEVYGRRDSSNNIIARVIKNKASGTTVTPNGTIGVGVVWAITILLLCIVAGAICALGPVGIVWTVVLILCFTNLPLVIKIIGVIFGAIFSLLRKFF